MRKNKINLRILFFMLLSIVMINTNAQTGLNFQGVARTTNNVILASQAITIKLSILQGSSTGTADYTETRRVTTNAQGLFTAVIGDTGAISTLGNFTTINWKLTPKFLKIEMDAAAGTNFITMGTTQFQYVAYAQFAKSVDAENINGIVPVTLGGTGVNSLTSLKTALTLNNVNNTADLSKPISTLTQTALDLKLNATDTSKYTRQTYLDSSLVAKQVLIGLKLNAADSSKFTKQTYSDSALLTKLKISDTAAMLSSRIARDTLNLSNRINLKANTTDVTTSLSLKENISNKSTAVDLGGTSPSDILFPTQKAVKDYVTANNSGGGVADGGITTIKIADAAVTDAKINTVSGSKVIGNITGNAATATLAGNITATTNTTLTTLSNLTSVGLLANLTVTNPIIGSITGNAATATSATTAGTATTTIGNAGTATKLATPRNINGVAFDGSGDITVTVDAGTLTGTILNATVTGSSLSTLGTITSGVWSGTTVAIEKGGTGLTAAGTAGQILTSTGSGTLTWTSTGKLLSIGDVYQGGKVAYILQVGDPGYDATIQKGLIAATSDQSTGIRWYNDFYTSTGATGTDIGTGLSNTNNIIASQGETATSYAAGLARAFSGGSYIDWYLPSKDELNKLYINRIAIGGFTGNDYWSSTESANITAWVQDFNHGNPLYYFYKNATVNVRAIRTFSSVKSIEDGGTGATTQQTAVNALTGSQISGTYLRSDGTNTALSTIQAADVPTLNQNTSGNAATATTAGNITATTNTTLTSLSNLATVGTITSGVWSGTAVAVEKGGTGLISAGTNGQVLTSTGSGTLTWSNATSVIYTSVLIGTQQWMQQNLEVVTYRDGTVITQVTDATAWAGLTTGAWCYYDNDPSSGYGKLYNWYAVNDPRGLAPQGWHIPTDAEWTTLSTFLDGDAASGGKMKSIGITKWTFPNTSATNESGYSGLPGGNRSSSGTFSNVGGIGVWWSATELYSIWAWGRGLYSGIGLLGRGEYNKGSAFSVRCIRD
jgi:uncharacterized protein (TIGR02145 family)